MDSKLCSACEGKGFLPKGCPHCQGKGGWYEWVPSTPKLTRRWITCDVCGGTGNGKCPEHCYNGYTRL
jgi:DnaJ-class molecular chaperone